MKEYNELGQIDEISGLLKSDYFRIEIRFLSSCIQLYNPLKSDYFRIEIYLIQIQVMLCYR